MILTILLYIFLWLLVGVLTQAGVRIYNKSKVFAGGEYYFWSAILGPVGLVIVLLMPFIEKYLNMEKPQ